MPLYQLVEPVETVAPTMVVAFDTWVDAGSAATTAVEQLVTESRVVARFDPDALFDYRARRPPLEIRDGRLAELTWPDLTVRQATIDGRDLLAFCGPEPDYRWREFGEAVADLVERLEVAEWISVGAIPAAVPHTRAVPIIGTASGSAVLTSGVNRGPDGILRVPSAAISMLEMRVAEAGLPALGYFAQIPHYVSARAARCPVTSPCGRAADGRPRGGNAPASAAAGPGSGRRRVDAIVRGAARNDGRRGSSAGR